MSDFGESVMDIAEYETWLANLTDRPELTKRQYQDLLAELLFQLISDGVMHPDHTADCGCVYSKVKQALGPTYTARIVEDARPNSPLT